MDHFPDFMKNPANAISAKSQSKGIEGYVFDGSDGSQMAFWECKADGVSAEHVHDYDEYFIPKGLAHAGEFIAGTRTIHAFGGKRAERAR
jgi:hypothetical protein